VGEKPNDFSLYRVLADYGAFPIDPYSHTPGFAGVQQPGLTGQVKEDVITRFLELGVTIDQGEISFTPVILKRDEFISAPHTWHYSLGGQIQSEDVEAGSLAFSLCGVPVIYRLSESSAIQVFTGDHEPESIQGCQLGQYWSQSLFLREQRVRKIIVDIPQALLR